MQVDSELVDNMKAIVSPYIDRGSRDFWWEKPLISIARQDFNVADAPGGNPTITARAGKSVATFPGTGSAQSNAVIGAAADRIRARANPDSHDYRQPNYASDSERRSLARFMCS